MMNMKRTRSAVLGVFLATTIAVSVNGQEVIFEDEQLCASGSTLGIDFGGSVAIGDGVIAVGSYKDPIYGNLSGSVRIFDAVTGNQLYQIIPSDGQENDWFGYAVAIDDGILAVSAPQITLTTKNKNGKIYLYDLDSMTHLRTIIGSDSGSPMSITALGKKMAMDDGIIVAGAEGDFTAGDGVGAAYLFDVSTGAELAKLLPSGASEYARFGWSVAIHKGVVVVGAYTESSIGTAVGAAYVFDAMSGSELFRLDPDNPSISFPFEYFGQSVAVGDRYIAVGTARNANGVYLYDLETGEFVKKLAPSLFSASKFGHSVSISNGILAVGDIGRASVSLFSLSSFHEFAVLKSNFPKQSSDQFGISIAAENGSFVVGANFGDGCFSNAGAAYLFKGIPIDTDSDGLLDDWEENGIPYTDILGDEQRFMLPGADPRFKDVYVEMDSMAGISSGSSIEADLTDAFLQAPVSNPNGKDGIRFHLLQDDADVTHVQFWITNGCWPLDFAAVRLANFGTDEERTGDSSAALLAAKAKAYRYCIVADDSAPTSIGGCGDQPGDNSVLFVGTGSYTDLEKSAILMHELGHNFGLGHGGGDDINGKANYPSIMNYTLSYPHIWNDDFWRLDYSRRGYSEFEDLNEFDLDETVGVGISTGEYKSFSMPFGVNELQMGQVVRSIKYASLNGSPTDFGMSDSTHFLDGELDVNAQQDLNYATNTPSGITLPGVPSSGQVHKPHNDWANVRLKLAGAIGPGAPAPSHADDELTTEAKDWMDTNFPVPPSICQADLTGDGSLDFFDISAFLIAYGEQDPIADFSDDGNFDFFDVSAFLQAFSDGCP